MNSEETKQKNTVAKQPASTHPPKGIPSAKGRKRTIPPEQLEKMRLARMAKAKERKEDREKSKLLQKQAIEQQKERIELLNITKKKKSEIKRRLAEVKRGETNMEAVEEIIEQYDEPPRGADQPNRLEGVASKAFQAEKEEQELTDSDDENVLKLEVEQSEASKALQAEEEQEQQEVLKEKVKEIKKKEEEKVQKLEEETLDFDKYYKQAVEKIIKKLPVSSKKYFREQVDNYDPQLDVETNINNMIENIQTKITKNVNAVRVVKETMDKIEEEKIPKPDVQTKKTETELRKKIVENKLSMLYKLR
jgi:hypothetical protein